MAIAPTGTIYKSLVFDGESSRDYGIYITGAAVYNAPERDVEMISIPGRNGAFALDKGRFENIEVSYPAGIFADTETDFAEAISDFRNYLCSRKGYVRLTDEYNPNEFRMAVYKSGLEVSPAQLKAGEFNIVFDCMPQRYLTSGETTITVADGQTITNPTRFASSPMLEMQGYGNVSFNGYVITREHIPDTRVSLSGRRTLEPVGSFTFDVAQLNTGDSIYFTTDGSGLYGLGFAEAVHFGGAISFTAESSNPDVVRTDSSAFYFGEPVSFVVGTADSITNTVTITATYAGDVTETATWTGTVAYDGDKTFTFSVSTVPSTHISFSNPRYTTAPLYGESSIDSAGYTTYIDCELGAAYIIRDGVVVSLNQYMDLGSDLPKLAPGNNVISYDDTVTELKVIPRWWRV